MLQVRGQRIEDRGEPVGRLGRPELRGQPALVDCEVRAVAGGANVDGRAEAGGGLVEDELVRSGDADVDEPELAGRAVRRTGVEGELSTGTQVDSHGLRGHRGVRTAPERR